MASLPLKNGLILFIMIRMEVDELHSKIVKMVFNELYLDKHLKLQIRKLCEFFGFIAVKNSQPRRSFKKYFLKRIRKIHRKIPA